jgi:predicted DsbA family dithiol-disulfide isomerase
MTQRYVSTSEAHLSVFFAVLILQLDSLLFNLSVGYIGKKHLNLAIETVMNNPLPGAPRPLAFSVLRVPFFLEPHYDEDKPFIESNRERLVKKWGGKRGWEVQKNSHDLKGRGVEAGIPHFNLDRLTSNTMASHRLIQHLGKTYGLAVSEAAYDRLNVYYFVEGHALNDRPRLASVIVELLSGLVTDNVPTEQHILDFLNGDEGRAEILEALDTLDRLGVHSIPQFIVEGKTVVDGAARSDTFVRIFREIEARGEVHGDPIFGKILGVPEEIVNRGSHVPEMAA